MGTSGARAKQVPVVGCLPGPISIFFIDLECQRVIPRSSKMPLAIQLLSVSQVPIC